MYQHFQFDHDEIARAAHSIAVVLAENRPDESPEHFAATVIAGRLCKTPGDYLQYGPYWWAVKHALRGAGKTLGDTDHSTLRAAYQGGLTAHQVFVAGERFRDHYRANLMAGTATFALGGEDVADERRYTLFDIDMEIRCQGLGGLGGMVASDGHATREPDEPILDDVRVPFEEAGELWTAAVDGGLLARGIDPERLVAELQGSGQIGRAIDVGKGLRDSPAADDADYAVTAEPQLHLIRIGRPRT